MDIDVVKTEAPKNKTTTWPFKTKTKTQSFKTKTKTLRLKVICSAETQTLQTFLTATFDY